MSPKEDDRSRVNEGRNNSTISSARSLFATVYLLGRDRQAVNQYGRLTWHDSLAGPYGCGRLLDPAGDLIPDDMLLADGPQQRRSGIKKSVSYCRLRPSVSLHYYHHINQPWASN
jgi:hypothetical protein